MIEHHRVMSSSDVIDGASNGTHPTFLTERERERERRRWVGSGGSRDVREQELARERDGDPTVSGGRRVVSGTGRARKYAHIDACALTYVPTYSIEGPDRVCTSYAAPYMTVTDSGCGDDLNPNTCRCTETPNSSESAGDGAWRSAK
eukprot:GHVU01225177.1.p2 GENE.GHVU01225177.1~~GHVU01225177.1.p2  ORF type:complete len:147 (+),score=13.88 GHVU01225177.1:197-637(+)